VAEFRLLGPVELRVDGDVLELGPPKQRVVLVALLMDAGRPVPVSTLVERVWGDPAPTEARNALYAHIMRIRRILTRATEIDGVPRGLERTPTGYVLHVDQDQIDLWRFRQLVEQGRQARDEAAKAAALTEALQLWHGTPLAGLTGAWVERIRESLRTQRLDAVLAWARAKSCLGHHDAVIDQVHELIAEYPMAEPLAAVLMRTLATVGRTAEALDCYAAIQRRLAEELGVDPSAELRALHEAILRGEFDHRAVEPTVSTPGYTVPGQLPLEVGGFVGREEELSRLDALLSIGERRPTAPIVSTVSGTAGIGKTALAVRWAHRVADRFPDGQLYVNLRGFHPTGRAVSPETAIRGFLEALGVPPQRIPTDFEAQVGLYRSLLAGRRVLVLLDNARDSGQVRPLLPGAPGCLALVTSRNHLSGLVATEGAHPITLDLLPAEQARRLLAERLGADRVAAEPEAVDEIIARCARLPLALAIVAAHAATRPDFPLRVLAAQLRDAQGGLDAFSGEDETTDIRAVFSWSYRALNADAARLFRLLGLHPGPDIGVHAAASLAGVSRQQVRPWLDELTRANLITEHAPDRFTFHDLLRTYAAELARTIDSDEDRRAALHRLFDHYLHTAAAATALIYSPRDLIDLPPAHPGSFVDAFSDRGHALTWLITEQSVLVAVVDHATAMGCETHAWQLAWTLFNFFDRRGHWHDQLGMQRSALQAARQLRDRTGEAYAHRGIGRAQLRLGRYQEAVTHLQHALELYQELGDIVGQTHIHLGLGGAYTRQGRHEEGMRYVRSALELATSIDYRYGQARALNNIGWVLANTGQHKQALNYCQQALALQQQIGDRLGQAATWDSLGYINSHLGRYEQAVACYTHALDLYRQAGDRYNEADTLVSLGDAHHAAGDPVAARETWQRALEILDQFGGSIAEDVRTRLRNLGHRAG